MTEDAADMPLGTATSLPQMAATLSCSIFQFITGGSLYN